MKLCEIFDERTITISLFESNKSVMSIYIKEILRPHGISDINLSEYRKQNNLSFKLCGLTFDTPEPFKWPSLHGEESPLFVDNILAKLPKIIKRGLTEKGINLVKCEWSESKTRWGSIEALDIEPSPSLPKNIIKSLVEALSPLGVTNVEIYRGKIKNGMAYKIHRIFFNDGSQWPNPYPIADRPPNGNYDDPEWTALNKSTQLAWKAEHNKHSKIPLLKQMPDLLRKYFSEHGLICTKCEWMSDPGEGTAYLNIFLKR